MPKNFFGEDDDETGITNEGPRNFFFFFFQGGRRRNAGNNGCAQKKRGVSTKFLGKGRVGREKSHQGHCFPRVPPHDTWVSIGLLHKWAIQ